MLNFSKSRLQACDLTQPDSRSMSNSTARIAFHSVLRIWVGNSMRLSIFQKPIELPTIPATLPYVLVAVGLLAYAAVRKVFLLAALSPVSGLAAILFAMLCALPFWKLRYADLPAFLALFMRCIGVVVLLQVLCDAVNFAPGSPNVFFGAGDTVVFYRFAALAAILAGIIGLQRPAFLVALFGYYGIFRVLIGVDAGIDIVHTDYENMLDTGLFATVGALLVAAATSPWTLARFDWLRRLAPTVDPRRLRVNACLLIWSAAVGAHLANYLYSGIAKLDAGGPEPLTWLFHNATQTSILIGLERGDNPLSAWPSLLQVIWDMFVTFALPLNALILGAQLLAPAAILHRRVLLSLTVFYDLFHIGVYLTLGALFLFWIIVNMVIFATAQKLPMRNFTNGMRVVMLLVMVFGGRFFYINHLGWLDGAKLASTSFLAETRGGQFVPIPGPYFGIFAYNIAQGLMYLPENSFPGRVGGNTMNLTDWRDAQECGPMRGSNALIRSSDAKQDAGITLDAVSRLVLSADQFARQHPWYKTWNTYYYYPHHMVPNPFEFSAFNSLKPDDIVAYIYDVDSVCLGLKNGRLTRNVVDHWQYRIPVPTH